MRDPLFQRWLVKERCRTHAKHSNTSGVEIKVPMDVETQKSKVQLRSELANVSFSSGSQGWVCVIGAASQDSQVQYCAV